MSVQPNEHQGIDELVNFIANKWHENYQIKFPKQNQSLIDNLFYDLYFKC